MKKLFSLSLTTGILCGVWILIGNALNIPTWIGFAGCTAFFAAGGCSDNGLLKALFSTLSGVLWAVVIFQFSNYFPSEYSSATLTAIVTFFMCIQGGIKLFAFIPGTFIGSFSTFAAGGRWEQVIPGLILGVALGFLCDYSGTKLASVVTIKSDSKSSIH
ncbi:MAG: DUF1097 domain-containing protein [Psychrilyobacter sp.]|uniref:DUF1097 domain-containing protein n=1 Tax=Psychrilyobacter sp. TaxID=2586924 RepID=UPI003C719908